MYNISSRSGRTGATGAVNDEFFPSGKTRWHAKRERESKPVTAQILPFTRCRQCIVFRRKLASPDYQCASCDRVVISALEKRFKVVEQTYWWVLSDGCCVFTVFLVVAVFFL